jgi:heat shock protein HslJ
MSGAAASLSGTQWTLANANPTITLTFDDTHATGSGGCNTYRAPYTVAGSGLTFGPAISTKRACLDPAGNTQETSYFSALGNVKSFSISGDRLTLRNAAGEAILLFDRSSS